MATKIRAGLYRVVVGERSYLVEDRPEASTAYPWRLTDEDAWNDPWRGDFATKRAAIAEITDHLLADPR